MPDESEKQAPPTMVMRRTRTTPEGGKEEQLVMDPLGHRLHNPIMQPWAEVLSDGHPGMVNNKMMIFGHHPKKEVDRLTKNAQAAIALQSIANAQPSMQRLADDFYLSHVEVPLELWMGSEGAAISAEKTSTSRNITREEKGGRFRR